MLSNQQRQIAQPANQTKQLQQNKDCQQNGENGENQRNSEQNKSNLQNKAQNQNKAQDQNKAQNQTKAQNQSNYTPGQLAYISTGIIFVFLIAVYVIYLLIAYFCGWFEICGVNWKPIVIIILFIVGITFIKYVRVSYFEKYSKNVSQEMKKSLLQIIGCLFAYLILTAVSIYGVYDFGLRNKYSICHSVIEVGSATHQVGQKNQSIINSTQIGSIIYQNWEIMFSKQLKKIYVYHGMSGIGKTTAFKQTINKFINENKLIQNYNKQKLFFYIDYQNIDTTNSFKEKSKQSIIGSISYSYAFNWNQVQKLLFTKNFKSTRSFFIQTLSEVRKFYEIVIILDEFNAVKQKPAAIRFLTDLVIVLNTRTQLKRMHVIVVSSQIGLDQHLNSLNSNLRYKYQKQQNLNKTSKSELKKLFNIQAKKLLSLMQSKKGKKGKIMMKEMFRKKRAEIVQISYGFEQLKNLIQAFEDLYIKKQSTFGTFERVIKNTYRQLQNYIIGIDKIHFCRILQQKKASLSKEQLQQLQTRNILYDSEQFYSGLIEVAFRKHFYQSNCRNPTEKAKQLKMKSKQINQQ